MIANRKTHFLCFGLVMALAGCGRPKNAARSHGHPLPPSPLIAQCDPGQPGGRLTLAAAGMPKTFNPLFAFDGASDAITRLLFGSLVNLNLATLEPGPGLAESWSVAPDQKTWTIKLRQGVRWSDGAPLTADDVVFTWNSIMYDPQYNLLTPDLFRCGGKPFEVRKTDDFTVQVVTPDVFAPFVEFFGGAAILPKHALEAAARERRFPVAYGTNTPPVRVVGCGPYRLKEVQPGHFTLLERNPEYWVADRAGKRLPYFDEVMFVAGSGPGSEAMEFLNGKTDACETALDFDQFKAASASGRFRLIELGVGTQRDFLWFNQNTGTSAPPTPLNPAMAPGLIPISGTNALGKPLVNPVKLKWFRNRKFRQAVSCAIDRERLVREVYNGRAQPIYGFISSENQKWNNPAIPRYSFDPARARALLAEIGITDRQGKGIIEDADGNPIQILFYSNTGNPMREKAARMVVEDLGKIGIKLDFVAMDFRELVQRINVTFDYECALMGLGGGGIDPASQMNVLKSNSDLHQWFPYQRSPATDWEARIDQLMDAQMRTLDFAQRKKDFDEVQTILAEELPMIYTVSPFAYAAIGSDIGNVRPSVMTPYRVTWNVEELYLKR